MLALFEHFGTTDRQLRNTYLQLQQNTLRKALEDRTAFDGDLAREDWLYVPVGTVSALSGQMALKFGEVLGDDVLLRDAQCWQAEIQVTPGGTDTSSAHWVLRSRRAAQAALLLAEVRVLDSGRWEFSWPIRLDLGEIITSLHHVYGVLGEKPPGELDVISSEGSSTRIRLNETKSLTRALRHCYLDFQLTLATAHTAICFVCDGSLFEEQQGIDLYVEVGDVRPDRIAELHRLTARYLSSCEGLAGAIQAVTLAIGSGENTAAGKE